MDFNWRRSPTNPYLPAEGTLGQMNANVMEGYRPLTAMTPNGNGMNGYFANNAVANNSQGFSVPNQQHGGLGQPNLEGYGDSLQAASEAAGLAVAKEQKIAEIQEQIKVLENRIATNMDKLKNFEGSSDKIAAIEARKIFSQDPTSIWRWKQGMDAQKAQRAQDMERLEAEKKRTEENNKQLNRYKIETLLKNATRDEATTADEIKSMARELNQAEELAKQYNDVDALKMIDEKRLQLVSATKSSEPTDNVNDYEGEDRDKALAYANRIIDKENPTLSEIDKAMKGSIDNDTKNKLKSKRDEVVKNQKAEKEALDKENKIINKRTRLTKSEIEWAKGRKNLVYHSENGREWFTRGK